MHCACLGVCSSSIVNGKRLLLTPNVAGCSNQTSGSLRCCLLQVRRLRRLDVEHLAVAEYVVESGERHDCNLTLHFAVHHLPGRHCVMSSLTQQLTAIDVAAANDSVIMEAASTQLGQVRALAPTSDTGRTGSVLASGQQSKSICALAALRGCRRCRSPAAAAGQSGCWASPTASSA